MLTATRYTINTNQAFALDLEVRRRDVRLCLDGIHRKLREHREGQSHRPAFGLYKAEVSWGRTSTLTLDEWRMSIMYVKPWLKGKIRVIIQAIRTGECIPTGSLINGITQHGTKS